MRKHSLMIAVLALAGLVAGDLAAHGGTYSGPAGGGAPGYSGPTGGGGGSTPGGNGGASGVTVTGVDVCDVAPSALVAVTVIEYDDPFSRPEMVHVSAAVVHTAPPGCAVAV